MRKIIITLLSLVLLSNINLFAQKNEPILEKLLNAAGDEIYLKDFHFNLEPGENANYSIVLSKKKTYGWYTYIEQKDQLQITLDNDHGNIRFLNNLNNVGIINFTTKCNKTAVYNLSVNNISNETINSIVLLTYAGKFKPKDIEEIKPIVKQTESKNAPKLEYTEKDKSYYFVVDEIPKFKGKKKSSDEFNNFINQELKYPQEAIDKKIEGKVFVQFVIGKNGYVKDAKVARGVHPSIDQEALRVIYSSPKWKPGIKDGEPVDVMFTFPIEFKLP